ncbi:rCG49231 [Rattus norvegicus]|uniref:RCG49231 n=1 Tax=Rattus norvegicus TaxID=10116 RepID=A6J3I4_RAT|nr:rCG49231 [Rattus norvegicus]
MVSCLHCSHNSIRTAPGTAGPPSFRAQALQASPRHPGCFSFPPGGDMGVPLPLPAGGVAAATLGGASVCLLASGLSECL